MTRRLFFTDARTLEFDGRLSKLESWNGKPAAILEATYFFPTSGGQPHDTGFLGDVRVIDVALRGDEIVHVLEGPIDGSPGDSIRGRVDRPRRMDHLRQHTGQHILSQAFLRVLGAETLSVHFGSSEATVDLGLASLSTVERDRVASLANAVVMEDRPIRVHLLALEEASRRFALRRPPLDESEVRVVEIEDFDSSACCGTHASRTGEVGPIAIHGAERAKSGQTRVRFVCGERAVREVHAKVDLVARLIQMFMTPETSLVDTIERQCERVRALEKERERLREQALVFLGRSLFEAAPAASPVKLVVAAPPELEPKELGPLALAVEACGPSVVCLGARAESATVLVLVPEGMGLDARPVLDAALAVLGGRGGGKPNRAQGAGPRVERLEEALAAARDRARAQIDGCVGEPRGS